MTSWSLAPDAITADALSTAFMVLNSKEIDDYCLAHPEIAAMIVAEVNGGKSRTGEVLRFGRWQGAALEKA